MGNPEVLLPAPMDGNRNALKQRMGIYFDVSSQHSQLFIPIFDGPVTTEHEVFNTPLQK